MSDGKSRNIRGERKVLPETKLTFVLCLLLYSSHAINAQDSSNNLNYGLIKIPEIDTKSEDISAGDVSDCLNMNVNVWKGDFPLL